MLQIGSNLYWIKGKKIFALYHVKATRNKIESDVTQNGQMGEEIKEIP
jgi:hypothetical protein